MLGYNKTGTLAFKGYSIDPDLKYWMTRNGVMLSQPVTLALASVSRSEYSLIDMRYLGSDKPLIDNTQEIGVTLGTNKTAFQCQKLFPCWNILCDGQGNQRFPDELQLLVLTYEAVAHPLASPFSP